MDFDQILYPCPSHVRSICLMVMSLLSLQALLEGGLKSSQLAGAPPTNGVALVGLSTGSHTAVGSQNRSVVNQSSPDQRCSARPADQLRRCSRQLMSRGLFWKYRRQRTMEGSWNSRPWQPDIATTRAKTHEKNTKDHARRGVFHGFSHVFPALSSTSQVPM